MRIARGIGNPDSRRVSLLAAVWLGLVPCAFGQESSPPATFPQQTGGAPVAAPAFDVASIRLNSSDGGHNHIYSSPNDGNFKTVNAPLKMILEFAYGVPEAQIAGAPSWVDSDKFDIEAKADESVDVQMRTLTSDEGRLQKQRMLQALLADRFKLATHRETRELPVYALVPAKGGPNLPEAKANGNTISHGRGRLTVQSANSVRLLGEELAKEVGRPVVNKTGIDGRYNITLRWTPDDGPPPMLNGMPDTSAPSLFTAIQEQLGMKLEPQRGPVAILVIDHIELPSEN